MITLYCDNCVKLITTDKQKPICPNCKTSEYLLAAEASGVY